MSQFKKIVTYTKPDTFEGGEPVKEKSSASYRAKCNFDTPRNPRLNKSHLFCSRTVCVILLIINLIMNIPVMLSNASNPLYALAFYSLWGTTTALLQIIFSNLATCYEVFFRPAYIITEISYSVNIVVVLVFWLILWPLTL